MQCSEIEAIYRTSRIWLAALLVGVLVLQVSCVFRSGKQASATTARTSGTTEGDTQQTAEQTAQEGVAEFVPPVPEGSTEFLADYELDELSALPAKEAEALVREHGITFDPSAMVQASFEGNLKLITLLLAAGIGPNQEAAEVGRPIVAALATANLASADLLYEAGAELEYPMPGGQQINLLFVVINFRQPDSIDWLLDHGLDVNQGIVDDDVIPLMHACAVGELETIKRLVARGADVNYVNKVGLTPLHFTAYSGAVEVMQWMVAEGANLEAREDSDDMTPLAYCTKIYNPGLARAMLEQGADPTVVYKNGENLLQRISPSGDLPFISMLVEAGLDPNELSPATGMNALHLTVTSERSETVIYLLEHGADPTICDTEGKTALELAEAALETPEVQEYANHVEQIEKSIAAIKEHLGISGEGTEQGDQH